MQLRSLSALVSGLLLFVSSSGACAETLSVGPGQRFNLPSAAIGAAREGDVIEIDSAGKYDRDVAVIRAKNLVIRGIGKGRVKLDCKGVSAINKGIFVQLAENLTVENIEFIGARCPDRNGAGIRSQSPGLTVRNCRFFDCEEGILGGAGAVLIEHCEFDHCGHSRGRNPTHSVYMGHAVAKLVFQFNYSTHTLEGHLVKSRAKESWILYNRLTDEDGLGSAIADFANGGQVVLIGNLMHKGSKAHNNQIIMFGQEGLRHEKNTLAAAHNTLVYEHRGPGVFAKVVKVPENFQPVLRNNLMVGKVVLTNSQTADAAGNLLFPSAKEAGLANPSSLDYQLRASSPAIDAGVAPGMVGPISLVPRFHYVHPCGKTPRPLDQRVDVGALELPGPK